MFWKSFLLAFLLDNKGHMFMKLKNNTKCNNVMRTEENSFNNDLITNLRKTTNIISDGKDHRFNENNDTNSFIIIKLIENYEKMELLKTLENKKLSILTKTLYIEEYNKLNEEKVSSINLKAGGLYKDWYNI